MRAIVEPVRIASGIEGACYSPAEEKRRFAAAAEEPAEYGLPPDALGRLLQKLEKQMLAHARNLEFEEAARVRDRIQAIRARNLGVIARRA